MNDNELIKELYLALKEASHHLDYCGYGDNWERECAYFDKLPDKINQALHDVEMKYPELGKL